MSWDWSRVSDRAEIRLWETATGCERLVLDGLVGTVQGVAISPDGMLVAAGGGFYHPEASGLAEPVECGDWPVDLDQERGRNNRHERDVRSRRQVSRRRIWPLQ